MDVLEQLGHFGDAGGTDWYHLYNLLIERDTRLQAGRGRTTAYLWDRRTRCCEPSRVFAFWRKAEKYVAANFQTARLDAGAKLLVGSSGIGRTLERDHLPVAQVRQESPPCR